MEESSKSKKSWVKFKDETEEENLEDERNVEQLSTSPTPPAVLQTSVEQFSANQSKGGPTNEKTVKKIINDVISTNSNASARISANGQSTRRTNAGFTNGDVLVSILPTNKKWSWLTPATFRPELVPEELMVTGLTLTVEEFVHGMELLTSDFRFNAYIICYKRLLAAWLTTAFVILLFILFSGMDKIGLFALGITWLILNAGAVFLCMFIKIKKRLEEVLESSQDRSNIQRHLDASDVEIVITGPSSTRRIPQKQSLGFLLRYVERWGKDFVRGLATSSEEISIPSHCPTQLCPCQYIELHLKQKRLTGKYFYHFFNPLNSNSTTSTTTGDGNSDAQKYIP